MKKSEFEKFKEEYERQRKRLEQICVGDFVWERVARGLDFDYHAAIVKDVNVDEDYVDVIDVTRHNKEFRYEDFLTEEDMLKQGFKKSDLEKTFQEYFNI